MAYIDDKFDGSKGKVHVRIASAQGGQDRNIQINGSNSGYYLGKGNDKVYRSGSEVASNLKDFIKLKYGEVSIFILTSFVLFILFIKIL